MPIDVSEKALESLIEYTLVGEDGVSKTGAAKVAREESDLTYAAQRALSFAKRTSKQFDHDRMVIPEDVVSFILATQPKEWKRLKAQVGEDTESYFLKRLARRIKQRGTLDVLRNGFKARGQTFTLCYFPPSSRLNPDLTRKYEANIFGLTRQFYYKRGSSKSIDLVLFLNGLPLFTAELKNKYTGQSYRDAKAQYKEDRSPRDAFLTPGRCLAHFAMDRDEVYVTTELKGKDTFFLPFNKGYAGGAGNPPTLEGPSTSYMWEEVWEPNSILNLIQHFICEVPKRDEDGNPTSGVTRIFPRYHQLRSVRCLVKDAQGEGPGKRYLIQHSAGSGKTFSIAWLVHQLASLHDADDHNVFDSVIVITDRRVLDKQLQDVIGDFSKTRGVVKKIDTTSQKLKQALEEGGKIIVSTLQKFPYISQEIEALGQQRFAVVIDEAHSSQSGEQRKHLNTVLEPTSLEDAEDEDEQEGEDLEDKIVAEMKRRGKLHNVSSFAFTATPKEKTLEMFGRRGENGRFEPFSLYSMRQAIEEGFILDVLQHYTTYQDYFKLLKKIEDDPKYDQSQVTRLLRNHVSLHDHAISEKVKVILDDFHYHTAHKIEGLAKAMIVTRSRLHAVRIKRKLDALLREQGLPYNALVAFSGVVKDGGLEFTESGMNGIPDTQTAQAFKREDMRFMVVANKFQTGFDEALLHTMYVDKKLGGVNAVQTLSRLNRQHPKKEETKVIDFVNNADSIYKAFQPYYEKTILSQGTDPDLIHDLETELLDFGLIDEADIDRLAEIWFNASPTTEAARAKLQKKIDPLFKSTVERYDDAEEESREAFRKTLAEYIRLYAFLSQVITFVDADLEKLYVYGRLLLARLKPERQELPIEVLQYVDIDTYTLGKTSDGAIDLDRGTKPLPPPKRSGTGAKKRQAQIESLSEIIKLLNETFGTNFGEDGVEFARQFEKKVHTNEAVHSSVEVNDPDDARLTFEEVGKKEAHSMVDTHFQFYKRLADDKEFGELFMNLMFNRFLMERKASQQGRP
jgi:type I restriction enzyme R subunit